MAEAGREENALRWVGPGMYVWTLPYVSMGPCDETVFLLLIRAALKMQARWRNS